MFIRIGNTLINTRHIIDADFTPASQDDEDGEKVRAALVIRFAVVESEKLCDYQGEYLGVAHDPYTLRFLDSEAETVWQRLTEVR